MSVRRALLSVAVLLLGAGSARAQIVQLPTFEMFSLSTTVSVPDRGSAYLGGVNRASSGSTRHGLPGGGRLFGNRGIGSSRGSSGVHVRATIIDHQELDRAVLAQAAARRNRADRVSRVDRRAGYLARNVARNDLRPSSDPPPRSLPSVEQIRRRNELARAEREAEVVFFFEKGQKAEAAGKRNVAKIFYQMAARRAHGALKSRLMARLQVIAEAGDAAKLAKGKP